jgi:hypothetical protein
MRVFVGAADEEQRAEDQAEQDDEAFERLCAASASTLTDSGYGTVCQLAKCCACCVLMGGDWLYTFLSLACAGRESTLSQLARAMRDTRRICTLVERSKFKDTRAADVLTWNSIHFTSFNRVFTDAKAAGLLVRVATLLGAASMLLAFSRPLCGGPHFMLVVCRRCGRTTTCDGHRRSAPGRAAPGRAFEPEKAGVSRWSAAWCALVPALHVWRVLHCDTESIS